MDALLIKSVLSCKKSLYWEYKCNMEYKWTKRIIINNDWNFHSHGRAWMNLFSARTSPNTPLQNHYSTTQWLALILVSLSFFSSPVYFNHCMYQHLSGSFCLGRSEKVIMMCCLKIEVCFEYSWTFDQYPNCFLCVSEMHLFFWEPIQTI